MKVLRQKRDGRWYWHWDPKFLDHGRTEVPRREFQALFDAACTTSRSRRCSCAASSATS